MTDLVRVGPCDLAGLRVHRTVVVQVPRPNQTLRADSPLGVWLVCALGE